MNSILLDNKQVSPWVDNDDTWGNVQQVPPTHQRNWVKKSYAPVWLDSKNNHYESWAIVNKGNL